MFAQSSIRTVFAATLVLGLVPALGCRVEQPPNRMERREQRMEEVAASPLPILPQREVDNAEQVIRACGAPREDFVVPIYSKDYNGPVRRLRYGGMHPLEINFIPSRPRAELATQEAPLPHPDRETRLPPDATWRFEDARVGKDVMITSHRLGHYLPCAGEALNKEF